MPKDFAVCRLIMNSNLVRLSDGQVRGFGAFEDAAGINADLTGHIGQIGAVAHQQAGLNQFARSTDATSGASGGSEVWTRRDHIKAAGASCHGRLSIASWIITAVITGRAVSVAPSSFASWLLRS